MSMTLRFVRMQRSDSAFAAALTFLAARAPFRTMPLGPIAETIAGAVKRGHYVLAVEDGRVVGFTAWALTDYASGLRWTAGEFVPPYGETLEGDTVVLMLGGGDHPKVALLGIRHIAGRYPGRRYLMNRFGRRGTNRGRFPAVRGAGGA
jgi:hypothetical protein